MSRRDPAIPSSRLSRSRLPLAFALLALALGGGCAKRAPEAPYSATGVRAISPAAGPTLSRFYAQAFADKRARHLLGRQLLLADPELAHVVRTDEFMRAAFDEQIREAKTFEAVYDPATLESRVTVGVDPDEFKAAIDEAVIIRFVQLGRDRL